MAAQTPLRELLKDHQVFNEITLNSESGRTPKPQAFRPFARHLDRGFLPYPGLRPFERMEARIFFGRRRHINELLDLLAQSHFVAVIGPSGCGKSSLIRAGVLAELESGLLEQAGARWCTATMRPGSSPMWSLAETLLGVVKPDAKAELEEILSVRSVLGAGPAGIWNLLQKYQLPEGRNLLLLVDQFEELFRYDIVGGEREANDFVALLLDVFLDPPESVYIVITMRTDYLGDCTRFMGLPEALNESHYLVSRLNKEELRQAIERPALIVGGEVEPALTERILRDMGSDPDHLPLMQHALIWMWIRAQTKAKAAVQSQETAPAPGGEPPIALSLADYEEIGDIFKALSNHANEVFDSLDEERQGIAEVMFRRLTERDEGQREIRHPTKCSDILQVAGVSLDDLRPVVERFSHPHCSFIVLDRKELTDETVLDIGHESLIRQWDKLKEWTDQEAKSAKIFREIVEYTDRHKKGERGLLDELQVKTCEQWWKGEQKTYGWKEPYPTPLWAKRYQKNEGDFDTARHYCEASKENIKKKARLKFFAVVIGVLIIAVVTWLGGERQKSAARLKAQEDARKIEREGLMLEKYASLANEWVQVESYIKLSSRLKEMFNPRRFISNTELAKRAESLQGLFQAFVNLNSGSPINQDSKFSIPFRALDLAYSREGRFIAIDEDGQLVLLDERDAVKEKFPLLSKDFHTVALSRDGLKAASIHSKKRSLIVRVWDLLKKKQEKEFELGFRGFNPLVQGIKGLAFGGPENNVIAIAFGDGRTYIWDIQAEWSRDRRSHQFRPKLQIDTRGVPQVLDISPKGDKFAASVGQDIRVWDLEGDEPKKEPLSLFKHSRPVTALKFVDDNSLVSGGETGEIRLWDLRHENFSKMLIGHKHKGPIKAFALSEAGRIVSVDSSKDSQGKLQGTLHQWDIVDKKTDPRVRIIDLEGVPVATVISAKDRRIAIGFQDGTVELCQETGENFEWLCSKAAEPPNGTLGEITSLAFSRNGASVAAATRDGRVMVWDMGKWEGQPPLIKDINSPGQRNGGIEGIAFSAERDRLAIASSEGGVLLWSITEDTMQILRHGGDGRPTFYSVAFSPNGKQLVAGANDGKIRIWDVDKQKLPISREISKGASVVWATFSPDGQVIASVVIPSSSGSPNGAQSSAATSAAGQTKGQQRPIGVQFIKVTGKPYFENESTSPPWEEYRFRGVAFTPNGQQIVTVDFAGIVSIFDIEFGPLFDFRVETYAERPQSQRKDEEGALDFDFRCIEEGKDIGDCWIAVPIPDARKLLVYYLGQPFSKHAVPSEG